MSIGERIKKRREELNMSQAELAKRIGVTQGSIGNYETGVSNPKMELMPKIFEALKTDANYIFHESVEAQKLDLTYKETIMISSYRRLDNHGKKMVDFVLEEETKRYENEKTNKNNRPTWSICYNEYKVSAGTGMMLDEYERLDRIDVIDTPEARRADYGLMVSGDSMEPVYHDGDIVLVEQTETVNIGEIGIFVIDGDGYIKEFGGDCLISLNDSYDPVPLHEYNNIKCYGRVIGVAELPERT